MKPVVVALVLLIAPAAAPAAPALQGPSSAAAASADTLTLREAVRIGLGADPDIEAERAGREAASGGRLATLGSFLPRLSAGASFGRTDFTTVTFAAPEGTSRRLERPESGVRHSSFQTLSLDWTLLDGGRRIASLKESAARIEAAGHRVFAARRRTVAEVRLAYFRALEQRSLVEVARRQLEARRADLRLTRKRYAIAEANRSEILGARSDTLDARMRLLEARRRARAEVRTLRTAMGAEASRLTPTTPLARLGELPSLDSLTEAELLERAVRSHPRLEELAAERRAAAASRWAARADYLPTVNLRGTLARSEQLGREGDFFVLDPSNDQRSVSLSVSWNLFGGFEREHRERRASATVRRVRAERTKRRLQLEVTVRNRIEELRRREERLDLLRRKLELARERVEVTRERYRLGDVSYLDLQRVIEQLDAAEHERIAERYAYLRAWAELERATGAVPGETLPGFLP